MFADFSLFGFRRLAIFAGLFPRPTSHLRLAALALLGLGLAGCLKPPPPGGVRLSYYLWGDGVMAEHERRVIADFERENPGITIELTTVIGNYNEKMQALIVGGILPDVMSVDINAYYEWSDRGILLDASDVMAAAEREEHLTFMPIVGEQLAYRGRYYCVPNGMCGVVPELNVDVFRRGGLPLPTAEELTWEWVARMAPRLARRAGNPGAPAEILGSVPDMTSMLLTFGGRVFDDQRNPRKILVNSPEAVAMCQYVRRLIATRGMMSRSDVTTSSNWGTEWEMFLHGQTAWFTLGIWATPRAWGEPSDVQWEVRPFPAGPTGLRITANGAQLTGSSAATKHPAEAKRFLRYLVSPRAIRLRVATGAFLPIYRELQGRPEYLSPNWPESVKYFYETMEAGRSQLPVYGPGVEELRRIMDSRLSQVATDSSLPIEQGLRLLEDDIQRWLDRQKAKGFYR